MSETIWALIVASVLALIGSGVAALAVHGHPDRAKAAKLFFSLAALVFGGTVVYWTTGHRLLTRLAVDFVAVSIIAGGLVLGFRFADRSSLADLELPSNAFLPEPILLKGKRLAAVFGVCFLALIALVNLIQAYGSSGTIALLNVVAWRWVLPTAIITLIVAIVVQRERKPALASQEVQETKTPIEPCPYKWLHEVADIQARAIREVVRVIRVGVWATNLEDSLPSIKCGLLVKNESVFPIGFLGELTGDMFFDGHRLAEKKFVVTNELTDLAQGRKGQFIFEQRLSGPEANLIKNSPEGKFHFGNLGINIKSNAPAPEVKSQQLLIPSDLWGKLDELRDKESPEKDRLKTEINSLRAQLYETTIAARLLVAPKGQLKIKRGWYHVPNKDLGIDVTQLLESMISDGNLRLGEKPYRLTFRPDPKVGTPKNLTVDYLHGAKEFSVTVPEDTQLTLPLPYAELV